MGDRHLSSRLNIHLPPMFNRLISGQTAAIYVPSKTPQSHERGPFFSSKEGEESSSRVEFLEIITLTRFGVRCARLNHSFFAIGHKFRVKLLGCNLCVPTAVGIILLNACGISYGWPIDEQENGGNCREVVSNEISISLSSRPYFCPISYFFAYR